MLDLNIKDDIEFVSDCCGAELMDLETPMCSDCKEHCEPIDNDFDWDDYCDAHPDFNAAMNGHPDFY